MMKCDSDTANRITSLDDEPGRKKSITFNFNLSDNVIIPVTSGSVMDLDMDRSRASGRGRLSETSASGNGQRSSILHRHKIAGDEDVYDNLILVEPSEKNTTAITITSRNETTDDPGPDSNSKPKRQNKAPGRKIKHVPRLSVAHRNDENDSNSNLQFKEFRRSLDILKRSISLHESASLDLELDDSDSDYGSIYSSDETEESCKDDEEGKRGGGKEELQTEGNELPSSYVLGTSMRSMAMRTLTRKTRMPMDIRNKRRKKLNWLKSFYRLDPRWQICSFFDDLAFEGVGGIDESGHIQNSSFNMPFIMRAFSRVGVFSVWRPTSSEAIRRMITGEGTGKGMDIKGKSAQRGKWSGFVPFLQIHNNEDKLKVGSLHADGRVRVFYPNKLARDRALKSISMVRDSMVEKTQRSMRVINEVEQKEAFILQAEMQKSSKDLSHCSHETMKTAIGTARRRLSTDCDYSKFEEALLAKHRNFMKDTDVFIIDDYASSAQGHDYYGLDIPEKLFWDAYVSKADITREVGSEYDTGRASMPEFQVMNLESLRKAPKACAGGGPRPVLWHAGCGKVGEEPPQNLNPLCPLGLLMAYEEGDEGAGAGKVTPVVSDFDCFLVGTRRVEYRDPMGEQELSMLKWCVDEIEGVLYNNAKVNGNGGEEACWTRQWLDVKKKYAFDPRFQIPMPKMGYADPRSSAMMKGAVYSLRENGAVRHGPECFNYSFPQPLDDKFLVISDTLPGLVPWKYVDIDELKEILAEKIDDGFAFPLNPKWILCDEGWKDLYDKLLASEAPNVQEAMNVWYPADVRERIAAISSKYRAGFGSSDGNEDNTSDLSGSKKMKRRSAIVDDDNFNVEIAELELLRYKNGRKGIGKLRNALLMTKKPNTKARKHSSLFSSVLLMNRIGKEADARKKRTEVETGENTHGAKQKIDSKKLRNVLRRRSSIDSQTAKLRNVLRRRSSIDGQTAMSSNASVKSESSESSEASAIGMKGGRPLRRRSVTNYIRKRLSSKKMSRRGSA